MKLIKRTLSLLLILAMLLGTAVSVSASNPAVRTTTD